MLETVKAGRQGEGGYPCLMDESNLVAMFQMLDVADLGYITPVQYREGQSNPNSNQLPPSCLNSFVKVVSKALYQNSFDPICMYTLKASALLATQPGPWKVKRSYVCLFFVYYI